MDMPERREYMHECDAARGRIELPGNYRDGECRGQCGRAVDKPGLGVGRRIGLGGSSRSDVDHGGGVGLAGDVPEDGYDYAGDVEGSVRSGRRGLGWRCDELSGIRPGDDERTGPVCVVAIDDRPAGIAEDIGIGSDRSNLVLGVKFQYRREPNGWEYAPGSVVLFGLG